VGKLLQALQVGLCHPSPTRRCPSWGRPGGAPKNFFDAIAALPHSHLVAISIVVKHLKRGAGMGVSPIAFRALETGVGAGSAKVLEEVRGWVERVGAHPGGSSAMDRCCYNARTRAMASSKVVGYPSSTSNFNGLQRPAVKM
jgi:hypothetical protein